MKNLDTKNIPFANKEIEEFKRCNVKDILEMKFKDNEYKVVDISLLDKLKKEEFNTLFFVNQKLSFKNLEKDILFDEKELIIDKKIDRPILILNYYSDNNTLFNKKLKLTLKGNIEIFEVFISDNQENFIDEKREFEIDKNSNIEYIKLQKLSTFDYLHIDFKQNIEENSKLKIFNFDYGSSNCYNIFNTSLDFKNSNFEMEAFINISKKQEIANIVTTTHNAQNSKSSIKANHILDESSHGIFEVKSIVNKNAKYSAVIQNSKTTILNDNAKINANPRLEIFIDELTASHGATTGSLDEDILYYLQTRGLSKEQASKILLDALEEKIINSISNEKFANLIKESTIKKPN